MRSKMYVHRYILILYNVKLTIIIIFILRIYLHNKMLGIMYMYSCRYLHNMISYTSALPICTYSYLIDCPIAVLVKHTVQLI